MKNSVIFPAIISLFFTAGCTEEELPYRRTNFSTPDNVVPVIVEADAGEDVLLEWPANETSLLGNTNVWNSNVNTYHWKKISGPNAFKIVDQSAMQTQITGLEKGVYEFELTVKISTGHLDKDTAAVIVGELSSNPREFVLTDQTWEQVHEALSTFTIENIYGFIPRRSFFKTYVRKDSTAAWQEVLSAHGLFWPELPYLFTLYDDELLIAATGAAYILDKSDIKILYH
jgi:hypothetical protein